MGDYAKKDAPDTPASDTPGTVILFTALVLLAHKSHHYKIWIVIDSEQGP
jgi:hypothetical protein